MHSSHSFCVQDIYYFRIFVFVYILYSYTWRLINFLIRFMTSEIYQSFRWQPVWFSPISWWGMSMVMCDFNECIPLFPVFPVSWYLELYIWDNLDWITSERLFHRCCWLHPSLGKTFLFVPLLVILAAFDVQHLNSFFKTKVDEMAIFDYSYLFFSY